MTITYARLQRILIIGSMSLAAMVGWLMLHPPLGPINIACAQALTGCPPQDTETIGYFRFNPPMEIKYFIFPNDFDSAQKSQSQQDF